MTFTLRSLLLAFMVIVSALGAFGLWGLLVGPAIVGGVAFFRNARDSDVMVVVTSLLILALLATLLLPVVQSCRESPSRTHCMNNLKQIALALHGYHDQYGSFPPACVPGPDGKPWHSWRVLILPFIEAQPLYAMYNFNEPWDGPNNRKLAAAAPRVPVYACHMARAAYGRSGETTYFAVVGPHTAWPGATPREIPEIQDGLSNTILVVEVSGLGIHWMEPKDLDFAAVAASRAGDPEIAGACVHVNPDGFFTITEGGTINVALGDGSVHGIPWGVPGDALAPLLTVNGGEDADPKRLHLTYNTRLNWHRIVSLAVLVVSTLLLWWSTRPRPVATEGTGPACET